AGGGLQRSAGDQRIPGAAVARVGGRGVGADGRRGGHAREAVVSEPPADQGPGVGGGSAEGRAGAGHSRLIGLMDLALARDGGVASVTLNRPGSRNALSDAAEAEFWIPEVDLGIPLATEMTARFVRFAGPARAKEIVMEG